MKKYKIGLDIGIASIGWCLFELDEEEKPCKIMDLGCRTFTPAEMPKDGSSLAVERREARGVRRRLRRRRIRLDKIKALLESNLNDGKTFEFVDNLDIYKLRYDALDKKLSNYKLARVLYSFAKRRGFQSNRKSETLDSKSDSKKLLGATQNNEKYLEEKGYRTIGEMIYLDPRFKEKKIKNDDGKLLEYYVYNTKNHGGSYSNTFLRGELLKEINLILNTQKTFNNKINDDFIKKYINYFTYQRSFDEGPAHPSNYSANFKVGDCSFIKGEKRAPKATFTFEYFNFLTVLNNLRILNIDGEKRFLNLEEKQKITNEFLKIKEINYVKIKKLLNLDEKDSFVSLNYSNKKPKEEIEKKKFAGRNASYEISKILGVDAKENFELIDEVGYILSMFKSDDKRREEFALNSKTKDLPLEKREELLKLDFSKFGNLSLKAMREIIPHLEKGLVYSDACKEAGFNHSVLGGREKSKKLIYSSLKDEIEDITSPVVKRAISNSIKVLNAIIDKYGSPCAVSIEVAREMSKTFEERRKILKSQEENARKNEKIVVELKEAGIFNPTGQDIIKKKLYEQQNGKCMYTGDSFIKTFGSLAEAFKDNNTQIDHIIPYSKCYDDSLNNKVLVIASENQNKGNRTPYEYMGEGEKWEKLKERAEALNNDAKKKRLLKKHIGEEEEKELNNRALNDTKYISKFMLNLLDNHLEFAESKFSKRPVRAVNGSMTSFLRKIWGLTKTRFEDDRHHTQDAAVVACIDNGMIMRVSKYLQYQTYLKSHGGVCVDFDSGEVLSAEELEKQFGVNFQYPYDGFKKELEIRMAEEPLVYEKELIKQGYSADDLDNVRKFFVSRMPERKVKGKLHKETVRSIKTDLDDSGKEYYVTKTPLIDLKLDKNGEIENYPQKYKDTDIKLYNALKDRLHEFGGDAKKAFAEPFYKPAKDGATRNIVKTVKLQSIAKSGININRGFVENGPMVRIDIFKKDEKYYWIPVYTFDVYKGLLPDTIVPSGKKIDSTYEFLFSLYRNDLIKIKRSKPLEATTALSNEKVKVNDILLYYAGADISTGSLSFVFHDRKLEVRGVGIQKLEVFEKYQVDMLGNVSKVGKEKRMPLLLKKD